MPEKRKIHTDTIREKLFNLVYRANFQLPSNIEKIFNKMHSAENSALAKETLGILIENIKVAKAEEIPLCQDCGAAVLFLDIGQDVILEGDYLSTVITESITDSYKKYYLRNSIVLDPLKRKIGTENPPFIHTDIVPGNKITMTLYLKGGGSENMTVIKMFRPTTSIEEIIDFIETSVLMAGSNACPPLFLGIGIGGTSDVALLNSKKAVLRADTEHKDPFYADLEKKIKNRLSKSGIGPLGFGGKSTVGGVFIKEAPAHIATLPVALNMNCHSLRFCSIDI